MPDPVQLVPGPLDVVALRIAAQDPSCGAVVVFEGCTRDHHEGRDVETLAFEAFGPMAQAQLEALRQEAMAGYGLKGCFIHHRLGPVPLMETAVAVVCASPHRKAAFDAAAWIMDELKVRVPIWKREAYADGGSLWVEGQARR